MNGLMVPDRLLQVEPGRRAVAVLNVPGTLPVFDSHFPRFPVLPGVLLLDAMMALATAVLGGGAAGPDRWRLCRAEVLRFRHFVRPGDQAEITVRVLESTVDNVVCTATVTVEGRTVATARRLELAREPAVAGAADRGALLAGAAGVPA